MVIPIVDCLTPGFRQRLVWLERIVDDDQVPAAAGQYAADRGRHPAPLRRRRKVMDGLAVGQPHRKEAPIPPACHDASAVPGKFIGEVLTVACTDDVGCWVVREKPGREGDRSTMRFKLPWWEIDDQAVNPAAATGLQFGRYQFEMRGAEQFGLRVQLIKRPLDKAR